MSRKSTSDILGFEYDWLACDFRGRVAFLSTAGCGFAPSAFLEDIDAYDASISAVLGLPETTNTRCLREVVGGRINTWNEMAKRGIYAFDAEPISGTYVLVAIPSSPVNVRDLPDEISQTVRRITFSTIDLSTSRELTEKVISGETEGRHA